MLTTQKQVREAFYRLSEENGETVNKNKRQNDQPADVRMAFVDFVDYLCRSEEISPELASRVTL